MSNEQKYREMAEAEAIHINEPRYSRSTLDALIVHSDSSDMLQYTVDQWNILRIKYGIPYNPLHVGVAEFIAARSAYDTAHTAVYARRHKRIKSDWYSKYDAPKHAVESYAGLYMQPQDVYLALVSLDLPQRPRVGTVRFDGPVLNYMRENRWYGSFTPLHPVAVDINRRAHEMLKESHDAPNT